MQQVTLYADSHELQRTDALHVLENYFRFVRWDPEGEAKVLDVGCGDGDVTLHLLAPKLPRNCRKIVATDVSEDMISFASKRCKNDKVSFRKLDVGGKTLPGDLEEEFDHVFSFYCLHWVQNQRQALKNIYRMLKPGGDMLLAFLASSPIFSIYKNMSKMERWCNHMQQVKEYLSPFQDSSNPKDEYEEILSETNFKSRFCRVEDREFTYNNIGILQNSVMAVSPFTSRLSPAEAALFWSDFMSEVKKHENVTVERGRNNNDEKIHVKYKMFVVFAVKPL